MLVQNPYHVMLDYQGYIIDPGSYRVFPAPLMGTKFATGRPSYSNLDFWQVGAMTDFSHGINQKFLVDPSATYYMEGIDPTIPGQIQLERDLTNVTIPPDIGEVTARYRTHTALYIGTATGHVVRTEDGITFTTDGGVGTGTTKIYSFYEINGNLFLTTGPGKIYVRTGPSTWEATAVSTQFIGEQGYYDSDYHSVYGTSKVGMKIRVPMSGITFNKLSLLLSKTGTPPADLQVTIVKEDPDTDLPGSTVMGTFNFSKADVTDNAAWLTETFTGTEEIRLVADVNYWLVLTSADCDSTNNWNWIYARGPQAQYDAGSIATYDGSKWTVQSDQAGLFKLQRESVSDLYYVMVESEYAFGLFGDGIRRSTDGYNWIPEPPDPLWALPSRDGVGLGATPIPRGFLIGTRRSLFCFIGGSSGVDLWHFPDYDSLSNFKGIDHFASYGIFGIEGLGIFFTEGSQIYPTNLNYLGYGIKITSVNSIATSGWDIFALVSDGSHWYLARSNLNYNNTPKYWWIVKKFPDTSEPKLLASFSDSKVFVFFDDNTAQVYNKIDGPFQTSGHIVTSLIDESLVNLQKLYNSIGCVYETFPTETSTQLAYALDESDSFNSQSFNGDGSSHESIFALPNPVLANKIQLKLTLGSSNIAKTPIVTDLMWKYILEQSRDSDAVKKLFAFSVVAEDNLEKLTGDVEEEGRESPRSRQEIVNGIWASAKKKQVLNFVGADNVREIGFTIDYTGPGSSSLMTIDRTNYLITVTTTGGASEDNFTLSYKNKTLTETVNTLNSKTNFTCTIYPDVDGTRTSHDLEPVYQQELKGGASIYVGTDITSVIFSSQSPSQIKMILSGHGSDRIHVSLREV